MEAFEFLLSQLSEAFEVMQRFEVFPGLSLFMLFVVILVFNVVITLFVPLVKHAGAGKADRSKKGD